MKKVILITAIFVCCISQVFAQNIEGNWNGLLDLGIQKLRIVFKISSSDGGYIGKMNSPDQSGEDLPMKETTFDGRTLKISAPDLMMTYEGVLDGDLIKGTFRQSGIVAPLDLGRDQIKAPQRPQTPVEPYPYHSEDITFENKEANITLAGTFTWPETGGKFPAVVLISGSGPSDRNETITTHKPFLVLADYLTRNGIAVLRFDDRGAAESGGEYLTATIQDFATDVSAAVDYLKSRKEINHKKIGLIGHSEGGSIAFIAGGKRKDIAFIISAAGSGVRGADMMKKQRILIGSAQGVSQVAMGLNETFVETIQAVVDKYEKEGMEKDFDAMTAEVKTAMPIFFLSMTDNDVKAQIMYISSPGLSSFLKYDPAEDLGRIKVPLFALNGDKDLQIDAEQNLGGIRERFKGELTTKKYQGLNHLFQHAETGLPSEYYDIEETISPEVLEDIVNWINLKMKNN